MLGDDVVLRDASGRQQNGSRQILMIRIGANVLSLAQDLYRPTKVRVGAKVHLAAVPAHLVPPATLDFVPIL